MYYLGLVHGLTRLKLVSGHHLHWLTDTTQTHTHTHWASHMLHTHSLNTPNLTGNCTSWQASLTPAHAFSPFLCWRNLLTLFILAPPPPRLRSNTAAVVSPPLLRDNSPVSCPCPSVSLTPREESGKVAFSGGGISCTLSELAGLLSGSVAPSGTKH